MRRSARVGLSAVIAAGLVAPFMAARADQGVARWSQIGPGSSAAPPAAAELVAWLRPDRHAPGGTTAPEDIARSIRAAA